MAKVDADTKAKLDALGWTAAADSVDTKVGKRQLFQTTLCDKGVLYYSYETGAFYPSPFA